MSEKQPSCISEIVGQCIWNNTYILKQDRAIFYTRLYKNGIMIINDPIDTEENLMDWISAKLKFELADQDIMKWLYLLTDWLAYLYGQMQSPRPDVMPDRREGITRAAGFGFACIDKQAS